MVNPFKHHMQTIRYLTIMEETDDKIVFLVQTAKGAREFSFSKRHCEWDDDAVPRTAKVPQRYLRSQY